MGRWLIAALVVAAAACLITGYGRESLGVFCGAALGAADLWLLRFTVLSYTATGFGMAQGGSARSGRFLRGGLLLLRLGIAGGVLAICLGPARLSPAGLAAGVLCVQASMILQTLISAGKVPGTWEKG